MITRKLSLITTATVAALFISAAACEPGADEETVTLSIGTDPAIVEVDTAAAHAAVAEMLEEAPEALAEAGAHITDAAEATVEITGELIEGVRIQVQDGESLAQLASIAGLTAEEIAEASGITVTSPLRVGQELVLPTTADRAEAIEDDRAQALSGRLERYLGRHGGEADVETYTVRTGDTVWGIARQQHGMPTWVLRAYNPGVDLDRLQIGQELSVPVLGDTLTADAAPQD